MLGTAVKWHQANSQDPAAGVHDHVHEWRLAKLPHIACCGMLTMVDYLLFTTCQAWCAELTLRHHTSVEWKVLQQKIAVRGIQSA